MSAGENRYTVWFLRTAALLLLVTGVAKLLSGFGGARILAMQDPIIGVSFRKLLPLVGLFEMAAAFACFSPRVQPRFKLAVVAWMATNFLVYRIGLWCVGWHHPCGCMGSLAGVLHLSDPAADRIMKGVLAYLLVGSLLFAFPRWRVGQLAALPVSQEQTPKEK